MAEKNNKKRKYTERGFFNKLFRFVFYIFKDIFEERKNPTFREYGLTLYVARQGGGKTVSMVEYLERMREKYPKAIIVTNFDYRYQDKAMEGWQDFFDIRNGTDGVIFAIDEIQNEFSSSAWKNFPETLLSEITQQRKQRIKIVATTQIFTRTVKQLREQANDVVQCVTFGNRWTFNKRFDAVDYNNSIDSPSAREKVRILGRSSFVHDDYLRDLFDTYAKVERMKKLGFLERSDRIS